MLLFLHFIEILKMQFYMQVCKWWKFRRLVGIKNAKASLLRLLNN